MFQKYKLYIVGAIVGGISGWAYWHYVGCASGSCPITSNPFNSTVYGTVMGGLFFSLFQKSENQKSENE